VNREVNCEFEYAQLQVIRDKQMRRKRLSARHYQRVAVLIVYWEEDVENSYAGHEVGILGDVFRRTYNFHTTFLCLRHDELKNVQVQITKGLSDFISEQDNESTLLIVYYAGHAIQGDIAKELELTWSVYICNLAQANLMLIRGRRRGPPTPHNRITLHTLVWAEATLQHSRGDVFQIFDCCYAGDLGRTTVEWSQECSEYLAATTGGLTSAPGMYSFTSAFTWALIELASLGTGFTTSELVHQIRQAPNFPDGQRPVLIERAGFLKRIVLAPLTKDTINSNPEQSITDDKKNDDTKDYDCSELRLVLDRHPSISEFEDFAGTMDFLCSQKDGLPVSQVVWAKLPFLQFGSTSHKSFTGPKQETRISPRTHRIVIEEAMESKLLRDRDLVENEKMQTQSAEILPAAKIVEQHREGLGAEHRSLLRSVIFRSLVTLIVYLFYRYCAGCSLLYIGVFYVSFCIMLINSCGRTGYDDYLEHKPGAALQLMKYLEIQRRPNPVLPTSEPRQNGASTALSFSSILSRFGGNNSSPHHEQGNSLTQTLAIGMEQPSNGPCRDSLDKNGYVLACINGFHTQPEMFHISWKSGFNDQAMFTQLQRQYYHVRGKWKRWLSLWSLHSVLFIQFEAFPHRLINVRKQPDLPPEDPHHRKIYEFTPRPTDICPPLGPNFLKHRVQHPDHAGEISRCCEQFPKKLLGNVATGDVAWGLQFNEGLDRARLSVVVVAVFASSTLVGCVFTKVTGNLQSGFALASYMMAALAVGVCSVQLTVEQLTKS
ncbi:MAG: hypothetical protein Q9187_007244, partial [Circinaria calcarea]